MNIQPQKNELEILVEENISVVPIEENPSNNRINSNNNSILNNDEINQESAPIIPKPNRSNKIIEYLFKLWRLFLKYRFCGFLLALAFFLYKDSLEGCNYDYDTCLARGFLKILINKGVKYVSASAGLVCLYLILIFYIRIFHWVMLLPLIGSFYYLLFVYDEGSDFAHHGSYNRFFFIAILIIFFFLSTILYLYFLLCKKYKILLIVLPLALIIIIPKIKYNIFEYRNKECVNWPNGFKKTFIDSTSCKIEFPKVCSRLIYDNVFDMTLYSRATCDSIGNNDKSLVSEFTKLKNFSRLGYPRVENFDYDKQSTFFLYQKSVWEKMFDMDDPKISENVIKNTEAWVDFTKNPPAMNIDVKKNDLLAQKRTEIYMKYKDILPLKNVILVFFDSVSRNTFKRKMKKTYQWLESLYDSSEDSQYESFQFLKYHSLDEHTNANIFALFHGSKYNSKGENLNKFYKSKGYITENAYDECTRELFNIYSKDNGWLEPYDHEFTYIGCDPNFGHPPNRFSISNSAYGFRIKCLYNKMIFSYVMEYTEQFLDKYEENPKFAVFGAIDPHEMSQEVGKYLDEGFFDFLMRIEGKGHLENSALLIFSDHGFPNQMLDYLPYGNGEDNKIENVLPFISLVLPKKMKNFSTLRENLRYNENKFITAYDLEVSLLDLIGEKTKTNKYGRNIFEKIVIDKKCKFFGIKDELCRCK